MALRPIVQLGTLTSLLAGLIACSPKDRPRWYDQLEGSGPCYRVDLSDGLDEQRLDEVLDLYGCLNSSGHFESFGPTFDALSQPSRAARPAGLDLAQGLNAMPEADVDPFALVGLALDLLQADDRPIDALLDLGLEVIYGVPAIEVYASIDLDDEESLEAGLLAPLAPALGPMAGALLDDDLQALTWAADTLAEPESKRWLRTLQSLAASDDPAVSEPLDGLLTHLGDAIVDARDDSNDTWADASGDSLRDLVEALTLGVHGGPPLLDAISPEAADLLGDPVVQRELPGLLLALYEEGHLGVAVPELRWIASVDADLGTVSRDEWSALGRMVRLLHDTNQPMDCSIDLGITDLDVNLGNLAVTLLRTIADLDPDTVHTGAGILSDVLGWGFTDSLLRAVANNGYCSALTPQVVDDLQSLDVLYHPNSRSLLEITVRFLSMAKHGQTDQVPAVVGIASDLYSYGGVPALDEALRDAADGPLLTDVLDLIPVFVAPADHGIHAGDEPAPDLEEALALVTWLFEEDGSQTGWQRLRGLVQAVVAQDGTWIAVGNAGTLLAHEDSQTARALDLLQPLMALDEDLVLVDQVSRLLGQPTISRPLLQVAESPGVAEALLASRAPVDRKQVPLAFAARLVVGGALQDLLGLVDLLLATLQAPDSE